MLTMTPSDSDALVVIMQLLPLLSDSSFSNRQWLTLFKPGGLVFHALFLFDETEPDVQQQNMMLAEVYNGILFYIQQERGESCSTRHHCNIAPLCSTIATPTYSMHASHLYAAPLQLPRTQCILIFCTTAGSFFDLSPQMHVEANSEKVNDESKNKNEAAGGQNFGKSVAAALVETYTLCTATALVKNRCLQILVNTSGNCAPRANTAIMLVRSNRFFIAALCGCTVLVWGDFCISGTDRMSCIA